MTNRNSRQPKLESVKASAARQNWSQLLNRVFRGELRVAIEKSGIPVAGIVSTADLERLALMDEERASHFEALQRSWEAFKDVKLDEIEQDVGRAVGEARKQARGSRKRNGPSV